MILNDRATILDNHINKKTSDCLRSLVFYVVKSNLKLKKYRYYLDSAKNRLKRK